MSIQIIPPEEKKARQWKYHDEWQKPALFKTLDSKRARALTQQLAQSVTALLGEGPASCQQTADLVAAFIESKRGAIAPTSIKSYRGTLQTFAKYVPTLPTSDDAIRKYLAHFPQLRSAASAHAVLRVFFGFVSANCGLPDQMLSIAKPRPRRKAVTSFSLDDFKQILAACRDDRERGLTEPYGGHGLRRDEAIRIDLGDIAADRLLVRGKEATEGMPLLPETRELLLRLAAGGKSATPIFTTAKGRLSSKHAHNLIRGVLTRSGVLAVRSSDQRIAAHTLRKTFSQLALEAGAEYAMVDALLRHAPRGVGSLYMTPSFTKRMTQLQQYSPLRLLQAETGTKEPVHKISDFRQSGTESQADAPVSELLPQLLDRLVVLGGMAKRILASMGGEMREEVRADA